MPGDFDGAMKTLVIRHLGKKSYLPTWDLMRNFTDNRQPDSDDEIWFLEHDPVFTQGQNGKPEHILSLSTIPIVQTDRGGQVTYHGPGQLMVYTLIDLKRKKLNIRSFVTLLENAVIGLLHHYGVQAYADAKAPGVYIAGEKICSIGLRVRKGCTYHGIALNIDMDLSPFQAINPCGFSSLKMTQLVNFCPEISFNPVIRFLSDYFTEKLEYTSAHYNADDNRCD